MHVCALTASWLHHYVVSNFKSHLIALHLVLSVYPVHTLQAACYSSCYYCCYKRVLPLQLQRVRVQELLLRRPGAACCLGLLVRSSG